MSKAVAAGPRLRLGRAAVHAALLLYTAIALGPILLILINAFKTRRAIFSDPLGLPGAKTFSLIGFDKVIAKSDFGLYFANSLTVTLASVALVLIGGLLTSTLLTLVFVPAMYTVFDDLEQLVLSLIRRRPQPKPKRPPVPRLVPAPATALDGD